MKTLCALVTLVLSVGAIECAADDEKVLVVTIQDLDLSDGQEAQIAEIRKESQPKVQEAAKAFGALVRDEVEKISAVLTPEQKQKVQALKEERKERREECLAHSCLKELDLTDAEMTKIGEIRQEFRPKLEKVGKQLDGLLSDSQKKAREDALKAGKTRKEVLAALQLTDDQQGKLRTVGKEAGAIVKDEMEKVRDILTEGQKEKLQELRDERKEQVRDRLAHRIANFRDLELTDEQKTKLSTIRQEYRPKIHEAGNQLRAAVRDEVERIAAVIK